MCHWMLQTVFGVQSPQKMHRGHHTFKNTYLIMIQKKTISKEIKKKKRKLSKVAKKEQQKMLLKCSCSGNCLRIR